MTSWPVDFVWSFANSLSINSLLQGKQWYDSFIMINCCSLRIKKVSVASLENNFYCHKLADNGQTYYEIQSLSLFCKVLTRTSNMVFYGISKAYLQIVED